MKLAKDISAAPKGRNIRLVTREGGRGADEKDVALISSAQALHLIRELSRSVQIVEEIER